MTDPTTIARWLTNSKTAVVFTGAGISTESGIPDFRSPGGIWSQSNPVYYNDFLDSAEARHEYWRQKAIAHADFSNAHPNNGHEVLARWETSGRIVGLITQNIDGLHQDAGSRHVLELHGTAREIECLDCSLRFEPEPLIKHFREQDEVPPCTACGGRLKHATISFGQALPREVLHQATQLAEKSDLFLAVGSSLVVEPAASLPRIAVDNGARLVIINRDSTSLDRIADASLHESIGETLSAVDSLL